MLIECERVAYASIATIAAAAGGGATGLRALGDVPDDLRITFDAGIAYGDLFARDAGAASHPLLPDGDAVMEIKSSGPFPLWLVRALDACEAYPTSFSKYGEAYRACMAAYRGAPSFATARASQAAAEQKAERFAAALRGRRPRRFRAPSHTPTRC